MKPAPRKKRKGPALRNLRLEIEYDGTRFSGWQLQGDARTVQGEMEKAIARMTGEELRVRAASRTDAGVHARGQVAVFTTARDKIPIHGFERGLNAILPNDVAVREVRESWYRGPDTADFAETGTTSCQTFG